MGFLGPVFIGSRFSESGKVDEVKGTTTHSPLSSKKPSLFGQLFWWLCFSISSKPTNLLEDSCHYLLYSLIFVNSYPVTMSIFPVLLFSLLHAATYTKKVLDAKGSNSLPLLRSFLDKLSTNQQNILKFIACNEIFLMPATVFMLFSGQGSLLQPFIYYRFLTLRYSSRRNPYCRNLFNELRIVVEHIIMKPSCPLFVRRLCLQSIAFISRLAPTVA